MVKTDFGWSEKGTLRLSGTEPESTRELPVQSLKAVSVIEIMKCRVKGPKEEHSDPKLIPSQRPEPKKEHPDPDLTPSTWAKGETSCPRLDPEFHGLEIPAPVTQQLTAKQCFYCMIIFH